MGCCGGCCGPSGSAAAAATTSAEASASTAVTPATATVAATSETDSCCGETAEPKEEETGCGDRCCEEKEEETGCGDGCSEKKDAEVSVAGCADSCCASEKEASRPEEEKGKGCTDGCCSSEEEPVDDCCSDCDGPDTPTKTSVCEKACCSSDKGQKAEEVAADRPSCCQGKTFPCCDTTCLDRLALRACEKECAGGCTNDDSCSATCAEPCDAGRAGQACASHVRKTRRLYAAKLAALGCICRTLLHMGMESCCEPTRPRRERSSLDRRRGGRAQRASLVRKNSCGSDECCKPRKASGSGSSCRVSDGVDVAKEDLERGPVRDHVVLSISGMTCTGCETKLQRSLGSLPSVRHLKTSLVLTRAEFDLVGTATVDDVIKHLERTTEFSCERLQTQGARLDLTVANAAAFVDQPWPDGVTDMRTVDGHTVQVAFDPDAVGARVLLEKSGWSASGVVLAPPRADPSLDAGRKHVRHLGFATAASAILTIPVLVLAWAPLPEREIAYGAASLALATAVQVAIAGPFYPKALKSLIFSRVIEMDLLIVLSTSAAYIFSVVSFAFLAAGRPLDTGEFFETSTLLVTLIMVGRYVAALARQKAVESIRMGALQATTALLVEDDGSAREIDTRLLQHGDAFKAMPESRVPTDGTVLTGTSEVDESMITGESLPVVKTVGSSVVAGSLNGPGLLVVRLTRLPGDNTISTLAAMVDEAKLSKPRIQNIADRVASYFVPVVVVLTLITFIAWVIVGRVARHQSGARATTTAITYAITVLIVSCPCAIGLAVPMVIVVASGVAAERGIIFRTADSIEAAHSTSDVVLDKTGTLTEGKLSIALERYLLGTHHAAALLALVADVKHPVARAVAAHLRSKDGGQLSPAEVAEVRALTGKGVEGQSASGQVLRAGNARWLGFEDHADVQSAMAQGYTVFCFAVDGALAAVFGLQDTIRADTADTVNRLQAAGVVVHILSGDDTGAVHAVARRLGIADTHTRARCTPGDKKDYIQALQTTTAPGKTPVVLFCGDGTNDAVALAQANIGVHMQHDDDSGGADIAQSAADVVLLRPHLSGLLTIVAVSRLAMRRIAFNFIWSAVYNVFAILLGAGAFVRARLPPAFAGLGELVSVLPVIAAAVLMRWAKV